MRLVAALFIVCMFIIPGGPALAQPWKFNSPVPVTPTASKGIFHHLESAGRRNIAVSANTVAVVWEDDRDGTPRIYLARKSKDSKAFGPGTIISGEGEAYEPGMVALDDGYFAIAWEENEHVYLRVAGPEALGPIVTVSNKMSAQVSLARKGDHILLVFRKQPQRFGRIMLHEYQLVDRLKIQAVNSCRVDPAPPDDDQLYPVVSVLENRVVVAWEDRRPGHTIIMANQSLPGKSCAFEPPVRISEKPPVQRSVQYGTGHGVARVALANYGDRGLFAAWADKRDFREGYDIYGADKQDGNAFGANVRVQDDFGGNYRQWHSTVAGHRDGHLIAVWTDERDGNMDIWFSWLEDGEWSEDLALPGASGPGVQYHPSITMDADGNIHAAWIERDVVGGPTRILYTYGALEQ